MASMEIMVNQVIVEPNRCELAAAMRLDLAFSTTETLVNAQWLFSIVYDLVDGKESRVLGQTARTDYALGEHTISFALDALEVSDLDSSRLANCGLLIATLLLDSDRELGRICMLFQVFASGEGNTLVRNIHLPPDPIFLAASSSSDTILAKSFAQKEVR